MASVRIYLDTRAGGKESPLKLSINHKSKTALLSLGIRVRPDQWDARAQAVVRHPNAKRINILLSGRKANAEKTILSLAESGRLRQMDATGIRDSLDGGGEPTFLSRLYRYADLQEKKNTRDLFLWCAKRLHSFDPLIESRAFEDIGPDYLKELNTYYSHLGVNTRGILFRNIRTVFNDAIDAGITTNYPFRGFRIRTEPTRKKALTVGQVRELARLPESEYRDIFLLMVFLRGMNIGDLLQATSDQIVDGRLEYRRNKVGTLFSVKIEPEAQAIIGRHKGEKYLLSPLDRYKDYKDYLHHLNAGLKKLGAERGKDNRILSMGLFPELSSNWARHTWATVGISLDVPKEVVARGMGHGMRMVTDTYIDFDMRKVDEANRKIIDAICK